MIPNLRINAWLDRPVFAFWPRFTVYHLIVTIILLTAILSRFVMLGERVMSHDEVNHVVPAYTFYTGGGYRYDPVTHGPLQFHLITLSYTLFGDSDFSARIPDAVFGIAVIVFAIFAFQRYLGKIGSLVAGALFTISPYISFYSRYTRNEIYIVFWGMALIWGVLRYLEYGRKRTLLFLSIITALHFTDKATSYIFTAELLIFLALVFVARILFRSWHNNRLRSLFLLVVAIAMIAGLAAFGIAYNALTNVSGAQGEGDPGVMLNELPGSTRIQIGLLGLVLILGLVAAAVILIKGIGWRGVRDERSFDLLILQGTIVLPLLAALPMDILGFNPLDYSSSGIITSVLFIIPLFIIAILIGAWWNWKVWLVNVGSFWAIFTLFYTTLFTQGSGLPMGLMGALGYWMAQQGVTRGTQPLYYYALVQIPMYEFLPAFGTLLAAVMGVPILIRALRIKPTVSLADPDDLTSETASAGTSSIFEDVPSQESELLTEPEDEEDHSAPMRRVDNEGEYRKPPILALLLFWSVMSLFAFSFAGERMPWLTTHIAMPMILTSGWSIGQLLENFEWSNLSRRKGWLIPLLGAIFLLALTQAFGTLLGTTPPFQGTSLTQLDATSTFLLALVATIIAAAGLIYFLRGWRFKHMLQLAVLLFIGVLSVITIRTAFRANFLLYDTAQEFLVYAHAARDPKDVLAQIEEISQRTVGDKDIVVAYDNDLLYPYWWYFRDYPNKRWYSENPTRDLRDAPVILVGSGNYGLIEPVVGNDYTMFEYTRLWWPSQAYYNLTVERVWNAFTDPAIRSALWEIWFNRNYQPYSTLAGINTLTVANWQPADSFRMYIRKDLVSQIWEFGASPVSLEPVVDPYEDKTLKIDAENILLSTEQYQFNAPRDIAFAPDGTFYVSDSGNHRILHLDQDGNLLHVWGAFGATDFNTGMEAPSGSFNEPWGLAVSPDGSVYVADTWNHRIQKFNSEGKWITMWGQFGAAESNYHFWGPRDVAVDDQGRVYITDTGNKRVVIFDENGTALTSIGGAGLGMGQFDEPVGIAVDNRGYLYVADTWNERIQVLIPDGDSLTYTNNRTWDIHGWFGDSLDNKPFLTVDDSYNVYVSDPIMARILRFDEHGNFLQAWGGFGTGLSELGVAGGLSVDDQGRVWVADSRNNRLMVFALPQPAFLEEDSPFFSGNE